MWYLGCVFAVFVGAIASASGRADERSNNLRGVSREMNVRNLNEGILQSESLKHFSRIVGGEEVDCSSESNKFPYLVDLGFSYGGGFFAFLGSGVLVSMDPVPIALSVAHIGFAVGDDANLGRCNRANGTSQSFTVSQIFTHYNYEKGSNMNNIVLLKLDAKTPNTNTNTNSTPTNFIPILNNGSYPLQNGQNLTVMGWGMSGTGFSYTDILRTVDLDFIDRQTCLDTYQRPPEAQLLDDEICLGTPSLGKDACFGDSGGPAVLRGKQFEHDVVVGLVSDDSCSPRRPGNPFPSAYVDLAFHFDWIQCGIQSLTYATGDDCSALSPSSMPSSYPTSPPSLSPTSISSPTPTVSD